MNGLRARAVAAAVGDVLWMRPIVCCASMSSNNTALRKLHPFPSSLPFLPPFLRIACAMANRGPAAFPEGEAIAQEKRLFSTVPNHVVMLVSHACPHCHRHTAAFAKALQDVPFLEGGADATANDKLHVTTVDVSSTGRGVPVTVHFQNGTHAAVHRGSKTPAFYNKFAAIQKRLQAKLAKSHASISDSLNQAAATANNVMDTAKRAKGFLGELKEVGSKIVKGAEEVEAAAPELGEVAEVAMLAAGGEEPIRDDGSPPMAVGPAVAPGQQHWCSTMRNWNATEKHAKVLSGGDTVEDAQRARRERAASMIAQAVYNLGAGTRENWLPGRAEVTMVRAFGEPSEHDPQVMASIHVAILLRHVEMADMQLLITGDVLTGAGMRAQQSHAVAMLRLMEALDPRLTQSAHLSHILQHRLGYNVLA